MKLQIGFGISSKDHVEAVLQYADIAVIGSKVIDLHRSHLDSEPIQVIERFLREVIDS